MKAGRQAARSMSFGAPAGALCSLLRRWVGGMDGGWQNPAGSKACTCGLGGAARASLWSECRDSPSHVWVGRRHCGSGLPPSCLEPCDSVSGEGGTGARGRSSSKSHPLVPTHPNSHPRREQGLGWSWTTWLGLLFPLMVPHILGTSGQSWATICCLTPLLPPSLGS